MTITKFKKYKDNLMCVDDCIISYTTHVADINHKDKTIEILGSFSPTTSKHINYVANEFDYLLTLKPMQTIKNKKK